jgi:hypothetical protein
MRKRRCSLHSKVQPVSGENSVTIAATRYYRHSAWCRSASGYSSSRDYR